MAKLVELALMALQFQAEGLLEIGDILFVMPARIQKGVDRLPAYKRRWFTTDWAQTYRNRHQFHQTVQYLKRQGLVVKSEKTHDIKWVLTKRGNERLLAYHKSRADPFSSSHIRFLAPQGGGMTIISFDIPEKERRKRDWIRRCLVEMDFKPLQKSVWVARGGVHEDFMRALRERNLLHAVHIFAVTKQGTIQKGI